MFIDNKYKRWYFNIIESAKEKAQARIGEYTEKHHVYPTSIFGKNAYVVPLSAKEHYVCHWLLTKFTAGADRRKMAHALAQMTNHKLPGRPTWSSMEYRIAKETLSDARKGMKFTVEHKENLSRSHKGIKSSAEASKKRSESLKKAHAEGRHVGMKGKKMLDLMTPESKAAKSAKITASLTGRSLSPEHRAKISANQTGKKRKPHSPETIAKMKAARAAWWADRASSAS